MKAPPIVVVLYMNCCHPLHPDTPLHAAVLKTCVFSCREKTFALPSVSVVTFVTTGNVPTAWLIVPLLTCAEKSVPFPTVAFCLNPSSFGTSRNGCRDPAMHVTGFQAVSG